MELALLPPSSTELHPLGAGEELQLQCQAASLGGWCWCWEGSGDNGKFPEQCTEQAVLPAQVSMLLPLLSSCSIEAPPAPVVSCVSLCFSSWGAPGHLC